VFTRSKNSRVSRFLGRVFRRGRKADTAAEALKEPALGSDTVAYPKAAE